MKVKPRQKMEIINSQFLIRTVTAVMEKMLIFDGYEGVFTCLRLITIIICKQFLKQVFSACIEAYRILSEIRICSILKF